MYKFIINIISPIKLLHLGLQSISIKIDSQNPFGKKDLMLDFDIQLPRNLLRYQRHVTLPPLCYPPFPLSVLSDSRITLHCRSTMSLSLALPRDAVVALVGTTMR